MASDFMELTVEDIHRGFADGTLTCVELVQGYMDRIAAFDRRGPELCAVITVNPNALAEAAAKDAEYIADPASVGPLHGIPVLAKDNYSTVGIATTNGAWAFEHAVALHDATIIAKLKEAGAIILAKVNLGELAMSPTTGSALGGQTKNPYDLSRTPGGSSGGTGATLAANFGVLGTGSDTGQSSRSPASANNCVALRPTRGLISRDGIGPGMRVQDEGGPLARTITDLAKFTDAIAGYDPRDPVTAFGMYQKPASYTPFLDADGLKGARLGLLKEVVGAEARHAEVNAVLKSSIAVMESLGATVVDVSIPDLDALTDDIAITKWEFRAAFEKYLEDFEPGSVRVANTDEFFETGKTHFHPSMGSGSLPALAAMTEDTDSDAYKVAYMRRLVLAQRG
jgi:amidase